MLRISLLPLIMMIACSTKQAVPPLNLANGKNIYEATCRSCHGEQGEGNRQLKAPGLTGLDGQYMIRQINNFRSGIRGYLPADTAGLQMAAISKILSDTLAIRDVAAYIDSLATVYEDQELISGDKVAGERVYQELCGSCHGAQGKGNPNLFAPQLKNLPAWYFKSQIDKFKTGLRGAHTSDKFGAQMVSILGIMNEGQSIDDVIAYLKTDKVETK